MPITRLANLIDGRLVPPRADHWLDVFEPATGEVFAECPDSNAADIAAATDAAQRAAPGWAAMPVEQRARLLQRLADLVEARLDACSGFGVWKVQASTFQQTIEFQYPWPFRARFPTRGFPHARE